MGHRNHTSDTPSLACHQASFGDAGSEVFSRNLLSDLGP
jgi:hypothetical protein